MSYRQFSKIKNYDDVIKASLLSGEPLTIAHLVKFERPALDEVITAQSYAYITDYSRNLSYDDGAYDSYGEPIGVQTYVAGNLKDIGDIKEASEAKASTTSIKIHASALGAYLQDSFSFSSTYFDSSFRVTDYGFREGDRIILASNDPLAKNTDQMVVIDRFSLGNTRVHFTTVNRNSVVTESGVSYTIYLSSPEAGGFVSSNESIAFTSYVNRDVTIFRALINPTTSEIIGEPFVIFNGIISNGKLDYNPAQSAVMTWSLTSHWGDFVRVAGRKAVDSSHRQITTQGMNSTVKIDEYKSDLGFIHADKAINILAPYIVQEERQNVKTKKKWYGGVKVNVDKYKVNIDKEFRIQFDLDSTYIPVVYGVQRVPSNDVFADILNHGGFQTSLFRISTICEGQISGILNLIYDDKSAVCFSAQDYIDRGPGASELTCVLRADQGDYLLARNAYDDSVLIGYTTTVSVDTSGAPSYTVTVADGSGVSQGDTLFYEGGSDSVRVISKAGNVLTVGQELALELNTVIEFRQELGAFPEPFQTGAEYGPTGGEAINAAGAVVTPAAVTSIYGIPNTRRSLGFNSASAIDYYSDLKIVDYFPNNTSYMLHTGSEDQEANRVMTTIANNGIGSNTVILHFTTATDAFYFTVGESYKVDSGSVFGNNGATFTVLKVDGVAGTVTVRDNVSLLKNARFRKLKLKFFTRLLKTDRFFPAKRFTDTNSNAETLTFSKHAKVIYEAKTRSRGKQTTTRTEEYTFLDANALSLSDIEEVASASSAFIVQDLYYKDSKIPYWGDDHRLLDTAYVLAMTHVNSGTIESTQSPEYIVKGKFIDCYNYDNSYIISDDTDIEYFDVGDKVLISSGNSTFEQTNIIAASTYTFGDDYIVTANQNDDLTTTLLITNKTSSIRSESSFTIPYIVEDLWVDPTGELIYTVDRSRTNITTSNGGGRVRLWSIASGDSISSNKDVPFYIDAYFGGHDDGGVIDKFKLANGDVRVIAEPSAIHGDANNIYVFYPASVRKQAFTNPNNTSYIGQESYYTECLQESYLVTIARTDIENAVTVGSLNITPVDVISSSRHSGLPRFMNSLTGDSLDNLLFFSQIDKDKFAGDKNVKGVTTDGTTLWCMDYLDSDKNPTSAGERSYFDGVVPLLEEDNLGVSGTVKNFIGSGKLMAYTAATGLRDPSKDIDPTAISILYDASYSEGTLAATTNSNSVTYSLVAGTAPLQDQYIMFYGAYDSAQQIHASSNILSFYTYVKITGVTDAGGGNWDLTLEYPITCPATSSVRVGNLAKGYANRAFDVSYDSGDMYFLNRPAGDMSGFANWAGGEYYCPYYTTGTAHKYDTVNKRWYEQVYVLDGGVRDLAFEAGYSYFESPTQDKHYDNPIGIYVNSGILYYLVHRGDQRVINSSPNFYNYLYGGSWIAQCYIEEYSTSTGVLQLNGADSTIHARLYSYIYNQPYNINISEHPPILYTDDLVGLDVVPGATDNAFRNLTYYGGNNGDRFRYFIPDTLTTDGFPHYLSFNDTLTVSYHNVNVSDTVQLPEDNIRYGVGQAGSGNTIDVFHEAYTTGAGLGWSVSAFPGVGTPRGYHNNGQITITSIEILSGDYYTGRVYRYTLSEDLPIKSLTPTFFTGDEEILLIFSPTVTPMTVTNINSSTELAISLTNGRVFNGYRYYTDRGLNNITFFSSDKNIIVTNYHPDGLPEWEYYDTSEYAYHKDTSNDMSSLVQSAPNLNYPTGTGICNISGTWYWSETNEDGTSNRIALYDSVGNPVLTSFAGRHDQRTWFWQGEDRFIDSQTVTSSLYNSDYVLELTSGGSFNLFDLVEISGYSDVYEITPYTTLTAFVEPEGVFSLSTAYATFTDTITIDYVSGTLSVPSIGDYLGFNLGLGEDLNGFVTYVDDFYSQDQEYIFPAKILGVVNNGAGNFTLTLSNEVLFPNAASPIYIGTRFYRGFSQPIAALEQPAGTAYRDSQSPIALHSLSTNRETKTSSIFSASDKLVYNGFYLDEETNNSIFRFVGQNRLDGYGDTLKERREDVYPDASASEATIAKISLHSTLEGAFARRISFENPIPEQGQDTFSLELVSDPARTLVCNTGAIYPSTTYKYSLQSNYPTGPTALFSPYLYRGAGVLEEDFTANIQAHLGLSFSGADFEHNENKYVRFSSVPMDSIEAQASAEVWTNVFGLKSLPGLTQQESRLTVRNSVNATAPILYPLLVSGPEEITTDLWESSETFAYVRSLTTTVLALQNPAAGATLLRVDATSFEASGIQVGDAFEVTDGIVADGTVIESVTANPTFPGTYDLEFSDSEVSLRQASDSEAITFNSRRFIIAGNLTCDMAKAPAAYSKGISEVGFPDVIRVSNLYTPKVKSSEEITFRNADLATYEAKVVAYENQTNFTILDTYNIPLDSTSKYKIIRTTDRDYRVSNNPAMQLLDYLTSSIYGKALDLDEDIDLDSFKKAARYCDAQSNVTLCVKASYSGITQKKPAVGEIFEAIFDNPLTPTTTKTMFKGTVANVVDRYVDDELFYEVVFNNVIGKLGRKYRDWQDHQYKLLFNDNNLYYGRDVAGTVAKTSLGLLTGSGAPVGFDGVRLTCTSETVEGLYSVNETFIADIGLNGSKVTVSGNFLTQSGSVTITLADISTVSIGDFFYHDGAHCKVTGISGNDITITITTGPIDFNNTDELFISNIDVYTDRVATDGNPVVKAFRSKEQHFTSSGYSLYDSDYCTYWRYLGWNEMEQYNVTRHQTNMAINTGDTLFSNVNLMLKQFNGLLRYSAGKHFLTIETTKAPDEEIIANGTTYIPSHITEDQIIGKIMLEDKGAKDSFNSIEAKIIDPILNYGEREIIFYNSNYLQEDNNVPKIGNFYLPGVTNYFNARINVKQALDSSRFSLDCAMTLAPECILLRPGDIVTVSYSPFSWVQKQFRIKFLTIKPDGLINVILREHDDAFYTLEWDGTTSADTEKVVNRDPFTDIII